MLDCDGHPAGDRPAGFETRCWLWTSGEEALEPVHGARRAVGAGGSDGRARFRRPEAPSWCSCAGGGGTDPFPVAVTFDSARLFPGLRQGQLEIKTDTPYSMDPGGSELHGSVPGRSVGRAAGDRPVRELHLRGGGGEHHARLLVLQLLFTTNAVTRATWRATSGVRNTGRLRRRRRTRGSSRTCSSGTTTRTTSRASGTTGSRRDATRARSLYCPNFFINRGQMAVFIEKDLRGADFVPPPCTGYLRRRPLPGDSAGSASADWIEQLFNDGITSGCQTARRCSARTSPFPTSRWPSSSSRPSSCPVFPTITVDTFSHVSGARPGAAPFFMIAGAEATASESETHDAGILVRLAQDHRRTPRPPPRCEAPSRTIAPWWSAEPARAVLADLLQRMATHTSQAAADVRCPPSGPDTCAGTSHRLPPGPVHQEDVRIHVGRHRSRRKRRCSPRSHAARRREGWSRKPAAGLRSTSRPVREVRSVPRRLRSALARPGSASAVTDNATVSQTRIRPILPRAHDGAV